MDKQWWLGILAAVILSVLGTLAAIFIFAGEAYVKGLAKETQTENAVITEEEVDQIKGDVSAMKGELKTLNQTNQAILTAILNDG